MQIKKKIKQKHRSDIPNKLIPPTNMKSSKHTLQYMYEQYMYFRSIKTVVN